MRKEIIYKQIQKETETLLRGYGFKKIKSQFKRNFPDSVCIFEFGKPRGYGSPDELVWQISGGVLFDLLNPVFRSGRDPETLGTSDADVRIFSGGRGYSRGPELGLWRIKDTTNSDFLFREFKEVFLPELENLDVANSLKDYVKDAIEESQLEVESINGLVKAAVASKLLGLAEEHRMLRQAIIRHPRGDSLYARRHLEFVEKK